MPKEQKPERIPLESIVEDAGTQNRVEFNKDRIAQMAEAYERGEELPPIVVYQEDPLADETQFILVDGFHRAEAARDAHLEDIAALIRPGTLEDAKFAACGANTEHDSAGLPRSNADKARAVKKAVKLRPDLSDRAIAEYVGVSAPTVAKYRAEGDETTGKVYSQQLRTGSGGRTINTANMGAKPDTEGGNDAPDPPGTDSEPDLPKVAMDRVGQEIPEELQEAWSHAKAVIRPLIRLLGDIRKAVTEGASTSDEEEVGPWTGFRLSRFQVEVDNCRSQLKGMVPYAVCAFCSGDGGKCKACKGRGYLGAYDYRQMVPDEMKAGPETPDDEGSQDE